MAEKKDLLAGSQSCQAKNLHCISACGAFYMWCGLSASHRMDFQPEHLSKLKKYVFFYFLGNWLIIFFIFLLASKMCPILWWDSTEVEQPLRIRVLDSFAGSPVQTPLEAKRIEKGSFLLFFTCSATGAQ